MSPKRSHRGRAREKSLGAKQLLFVKAFVANGLNATRAAQEAGYKQPHMAGSRLMEKDEVRRAVDAAIQPKLRQYEVTADRLIQELANVAFFNLGDTIHVTNEGDPTVDLNRLTEQQRGALSQVEIDDVVVGCGDNAREVRRVRVRAHDKLRALELLAKHLGLLVDRRELSVPNDTASLLTAARLRVIDDQRKRFGLLE